MCAISVSGISPTFTADGHVASNNINPSAIIKILNAKLVKSNLFVFILEYATKARMEMKNARMSPPT